MITTVLNSQDDNKDKHSSILCLLTHFYNILQMFDSQFIKAFSQPETIALSAFFSPVLRKDFISLHPDDKTSPWWIHNYRWFHISSELLQSPYIVIVTEVICIKLIIPNHKGHKSVHYQFWEKCFKRTFFYIVQGKRGRILPSIKWSLAVSN